MIIKRNFMLELGFHVLGLDFGSNSSVYCYRKYYPKQLLMLIADAHEDSLYAFRFKDKKEMKDFLDNKFAITLDPSKDGRRAMGGGVYKFMTSINMNHELNIHKITRRKHLTDGIELFEKKYISQKQLT